MHTHYIDQDLDKKALKKEAFTTLTNTNREKSPQLCDRLACTETRVLLRPRFLFFFLRVNSNFTWIHCSRTVYYCLCTVHVLKIIKNRSHDTIYTIKNYFATVFSVFSFQQQ